MSGLFAALINADDAGIRQDTDKLIERSKRRGNDSVDLVIKYVGVAPQELKLKGKLYTTRMPVPETLGYSLIGCAYGKPAYGATRSHPPFTSANGEWVVVWDGGIPQDGHVLVETIAETNAENLKDLQGTFALVALNTKSNLLYWCAKAKPLYALYDSLGRGIRIASSSEYFEGMYHPFRNAQPISLGPNAYGMVSLNNAVSSPLPLDKGEGTLVLCGGGLDSLVATYAAQEQYHNEGIALLNVQYGAHAEYREWSATLAMQNALSNAVALRIKTDFFQKYATDTSLFPDGKPVNMSPKKGMASEWVPARNTALMAMALSFAESNGHARIVTGINADASSAYPDNEDEWLFRWKQLVPYCVNTGRSVDLVAPLQGMSKTDVVKEAMRLEIPEHLIAKSWSCYGGAALHCGECSSCKYRRGAFRNARVTDPTEYYIDDMSTVRA